jgi:hypothetical protein
MFRSTNSAHVAHHVAAGYVHAAGHIDYNIAGGEEEETRTRIN